MMDDYILILSMVAYMFPFIVAGIRQHKSAMAIGVLNFFTGWTGIGWFISLIWCLTGNVKTDKQNLYGKTIFRCKE